MLETKRGIGYIQYELRKYISLNFHLIPQQLLYILCRIMTISSLNFSFILFVAYLFMPTLIFIFLILVRRVL